MALINWSDEYSVKIKSIDRQHSKLIDLINELHSAMKEGKGKEFIGKAIDKLIDYTQVHFKHEESLMEKYSYPGYLKHKSLHDDLVRQVLEIKKNFSEGKVVLSQEVLNFLKKWLVEHIVGTDKQYTSFLNIKGVA
ncbi:MAG: bacteriohemerythrin [Ignavibacteriaceae bacterium]